MHFYFFPAERHFIVLILIFCVLTAQYLLFLRVFAERTPNWRMMPGGVGSIPMGLFDLKLS